MNLSSSFARNESNKSSSKVSFTLEDQMDEAINARIWKMK